MDLAGWEQRYRSEMDAVFEPSPTPLLAETVSHLPPGRALDLASGTGRNALWLAQRGWSVTAVDGSPTAVKILRRCAEQMNVVVDAQVADLERAGFTIEPDHWDLIAMCYYLQRDLFESSKQGLVPGGVIVVIVLLAEPGKDNSFRAQPGELRRCFEGWEILHDREGSDTWQHKVAEIVARRPVSEVR